LQRFGEVLEETSRLQQENCVVVRASLAGAQDALADLQQMQRLSRDILNGLADYARQLDESLRGKLQRFGEMLDEMSRQQQESCVVVRASLTGAREAVADLQKLRDMSAEMMDSLTDYVQKLDDSRRSAEGVYDQLEQITRRQDEYLKTVGAMQADVGRLADAMQKAAADLRASAANVEKAHIQANKALQDEFNSTMDAYRDYVNQFTQRVDYLTDSISGALQAMPDAVNEANNRFLDQVDRMTDAMVQAQRALEVTADRIYRG
ncbi:MAG: hypothetical protein IKN05_10035, partial [Clostridia bacterium]|nr:hypothetical protein [Clostridia bacterium]